jgi:hypothetical protein
MPGVDRAPKARAIVTVKANHASVTCHFATGNSFITKNASGSIRHSNGVEFAHGSFWQALRYIDPFELNRDLTP